MTRGGAAVACMTSVILNVTGAGGRPAGRAGVLPGRRAGLGDEAPDEAQGDVADLAAAAGPAPAWQEARRALAAVTLGLELLVISSEDGMIEVASPRLRAGNAIRLFACFFVFCYDSRTLCKI
jgi:hypothetical protein